jgi:Protein of unknown function (DUF3558)
VSNSSQRPGAAASVIAASSVLVLTGCAGATSAPAPATLRPPATLGPSPTQPVGPIPPVNNPRDITAMTRRPCDVLTAQQAIGFRLDLPGDQLAGLHDTLRCQWTTTTGSAREIVRMVDVSLSADNAAFEAAYSRDRGLAFFELTNIAGYPAIVTRTNPNLPICTVKVKVAEQQSISVDYEDKVLNKNPQQSCEVGKRVAAAVLANVPPKS